MPDKEQLIEIVFDKKTKVFFKKPSRQTLGLAMAKGASDPLASVEVVIENCYDSGDVTKEVLMNDVGYLFSMSTVINQVLGLKATEVKNG
jgi:hypothetical protein